MAEALSRRFALADILQAGHYGATGPGTPGIELEARPGLAIFELQLWPESRARVLAALDDGIAQLAVAPDHWLLTGTAGLLSEFAATFDAHDGLLVDQSHGLTTFRLSGPAARSLLSKGTTIDLRPDRFTAGSVAGTRLDHIDVTLHGVGADMFDIYCRRSYAVSLYEWLLACAGEFGCRVLDAKEIT